MERDINEIISKAIAGSYMNEEERQQLAFWLKDKGNERFYQKLENLHDSSQDVIKLPHMDVDVAYKKHLGRVKRTRVEKRKIFMNNMMRYAAVVLIVVSVSLVMFYVGRNSDVIHQEDQWLAGVAPGSQKAELILADGEVMDLEEEREEQIEEKDGTQIQNTGTSLIYAAGQKSKLVETTYNSLVVPRGGEYQLVLGDGTKVWINAESRLRYPTQFSEDQRVVLLEGEAYFEVSKDRSRPFIVKTQGVDVRVLGTSFNVSSYNEDEKILTTLVEGSVEVIDSEQKESKLILKPGYQAVYSKKENELNAQKVNVDLYTSWKDGRFVFDRTELDDIMTQISRWYDVKVFYQNSDINSIRFTGSLKRYDRLDRFLSMIEKTNEVRFVIGDKTITVQKTYSK